MSKQRKWQVAAAIFLLIAFGSLLTPFYAEICEKDAYTGNKECAAHHVAVSLILYIGQILEAHAGAVTGIATVALAIITWRIVTLGQEQSTTIRAELRAYLSIIIGPAVYQDSTRSLKFEAKPMIVNNGKTPAYNVRYRSRSEVLTDSVAKNYIFSAPPDTPKSQSSIGPGENRLLSAILDHVVPDSEVQDIMNGDGKALWVWGVVHYDDVFGKPHFTQFCQRLSWLTDRSNIIGLYDGRFGLSD